MAARNLLPGFGGAYTSEALSSASTSAADTLDCSKMDYLAFYVSSTGSPGGSVDIQQGDGTTFDTTTPLVSGLSATDGTVLRLDPTDGPFGVIKIVPNITAGTSESVTIKIVGQAIDRV